MKNKIKQLFTWGSENIGWMFVPFTWIRADRQKHGMIAWWIATVTFFLLVGFLSPDKAILWKDLLFTTVGVVIATLVGHIKETLDAKKENNSYDKTDVSIMIYASAGIGILWTIIRQITFN